MHRHQLQLRALLPLLAVLSLQVSACSDDSGNADRTPADQPVDMADFATDTSLQPGTYAMPFLQDFPDLRAYIDVPGDGYFAWGGGAVVGDDDGAGDIAFWGRVERVDTDPCGGGTRVGAGTSVQDLVDLLVAQRHMAASRPVPTRISGYRGVYVTVTAPAHIDRCRGNRVTIWGNSGETWLQSDAAGTEFHAWILDVRGQRVVAGARVVPDARAGQKAGLVDMVRAARFAPVDRS